jgi:hypothetical protein
MLSHRYLIVDVEFGRAGGKETQSGAAPEEVVHPFDCAQDKP